MPARNDFCGSLLTRNRFVSGVHTRHGILLYATLMNKLSAATVAQIIKEAVQVELAFVEESLPEGLTGLTRVDMREYVKYIANSIYSALGCEPGQELFSGARNRLTFTNRIELDVKKTNFFERKVTDYGELKNDMNNGSFGFEI